MRVRVNLPQLHQRSTRAATVAMVGVLAGATGVAGIAHQLTLAEQAAPVEAEPAESEYTPSMRAIIPAGLRDAEGADAAVEDGVGRGPVGPPSAYPGSIVKAPDAAVAAYQRAEAVINQAAECGLDWTVLAAVARVESNHGQGEDRDHKVGRKGRVKPAYVGAPLNGKGGRGELADTDLGELDGNRSWDAPVGALGLLPTRWSSVAVDADGDDERDPQDLDDAALGAAVFVCAEITSGREAAEEEGGLDTSAARSSRRPARPATPGERPVKPAEVGGFDASGGAGGLDTPAARSSRPAARPATADESDGSDGPATADESDGSDGPATADESDGPGSVGGRADASASERRVETTDSKQLLRAALREYHDGKRFVSTVLALRKRYDKQAEKLPAYEPPPGGLDVPDLPPLCDCDPPRTARDRNHDKNDDGGKRSPGGKKDGPRSPSPGGKSPQPGGDGGSGTPGTPGTPSPSDPSSDPPTDPPTSDEPTDPGTTPTDDPSSDPPTDDPPTSDDPSPTKTTSDPPASSSATTDPSITP